MTDIKPEWVEAGAQALVGGTNYVMSGDNGYAGTMNRLTAQFVIAAVEPLIRADERSYSRTAAGVRQKILERIEKLAVDTEAEAEKEGRSNPTLRTIKLIRAQGMRDVISELKKESAHD